MLSRKVKSVPTRLENPATMRSKYKNDSFFFNGLNSEWLGSEVEYKKMEMKITTEKVSKINKFEEKRIDG